MSASMDSDDEDTFVSIGTPLEILDEDEIPKKALSIQEQKAKDKHGRQRFHGAFTGGFSAGYFNTVGTKEGFTPSTFVSSRASKGESSSKYDQRPENFMDDEDFGEFGIAPKKITASDDFASLSSLRKRKAPVAERTAIPDLNLEDLVLPSKVPVGMRLLKKMGWKEGQGVGPRVKKKSKAKTGQKVYGCSMKPPGDDEGSSSDDEYLRDVTFAPKDISPFTFVAKDNLHGIGYRGLDPKAALHGHVNLFEPPAPVSKSGKKGIIGQAFGVGALNEDDDDVYGIQSMSGYDRELTDERADNTFGWTAPRHKGRSTKLAITGPDYVGKMLEGFTLSSKPSNTKKIFPPPQLPRNFRPMHVFKKPEVDLVIPVPGIQQPDQQQKDKEVKLDANMRGAILEEKSLIGSVFDLVPKEDQEKMRAVKEGKVYQAPAMHRGDSGPGSSSSATAISSTPAGSTQPSPSTSEVKSKSSRFSAPASTSEEKVMNKEEKIESFWRDVTGQKSVGGFKPFARDPEKQARYDHYLELQKQGKKYDFDDANLTEWEREREREEFTRAAKLYKPLSSMMSFRFTRGKFSDDIDDTVEMPADEPMNKSDQAKAAEMKMFGKMTREKIKWHPDKLLCKRFNVANPYPDSSQVGTAKVRRDKFSVFNFLNVPEEPEKKEKTAPKAISYKDIPAPVTTLEEEVVEKPSKPVVSFVIGTAKKKDTVELTREEALGSGSQEPEDVEMEDQDSGGKEAKEEERPPMDLFKAIFEASESSSESSSEEEKEEEDIREIISKPIEETPKVKMTQNVEKRTHKFSLPSQREKKSRWDPVESTEIQAEGVPNSGVEDADKGSPADMDMDPHVGPQLSEAVKERLGLNDNTIEQQTDFSSAMAEDSDVYGPLPLLAERPDSGEKYVEITKDSERHRKKKHKHKEKHKHKKKKSKKEKKSKHKKKKKHKEKSKHKEKKKAMTSSSSSGSEADSESSDNDNGEEPSTRDLLSKIRSLPGKRLSAADFM